MKGNTTLLIAFGFVLGGLVGFTLGMIAAPYWIEIKTLENGYKLPALIEGYGDIYGGLLSAIVAFVAAYFVWWIQHRKEEQDRADMQSIYAHRLMLNVKLLYTVMLEVKTLAKVNYPDRTANFHDLNRHLERFKAQSRAVRALPACDPILGKRVHLHLESVKLHAPYVARGMEEASMTGDPAVIEQTVIRFHTVDRMLTNLLDILEDMAQTAY